MKRELEQQMLELIYGLLDEHDADLLQQRIESEGEYARAYDDALRSADMFSQAARLDISLPELRCSDKIPQTETDTVPKAADKPGINPKVSGPGSLLQSSRRSEMRKYWDKFSNRLILTCSLLLILLAVGGYGYQRMQVREIASDYVRVRMLGPSAIVEDAPQQFVISTESITGKTANQPIQFSLYRNDDSTDVDGLDIAEIADKQAEPVFKTKAIPDAKGTAVIDIPQNTFREVADASFANYQVRLDQPQGEEMTINGVLPVQRRKSSTFIQANSTRYTPDQQLAFRSVTLDRFTQQPVANPVLTFSINDDHENTLQRFDATDAPAPGTLVGNFTIPANQNPGRYCISALKNKIHPTADKYCFAINEPNHAEEASLTRSTLADRKLSVMNQPTDTASSESPEISAGQPTAITPSRNSTATAPQIEFHPEGGPLTVGVANRVYMLARQPEDNPVPDNTFSTSGTILNQYDDRVAMVELNPSGVGLLELEPKDGEEFRLVLDTSTGDKSEFSLPKVSQTSEIVLDTGMSVFEANSPIQCNVRAMRAGLPLAVTVELDDTTLAQQTLVTREQANTIDLPLADDIAGVIAVAVYDCRVSPPYNIARRLVYRKPAAWLNFTTTLSTGDKIIEPQLDSYPNTETAETKTDFTNSLGLPVYELTRNRSTTMAIETRSSDEKPVDAVLSVSMYSMNPASDCLETNGAASMPNYFFLSSRLAAETPWYEKENAAASSDPIDKLIALFTQNDPDRNLSPDQLFTAETEAQRAFIDTLLATQPLHLRNDEPQLLAADTSAASADHATAGIVVTESAAPIIFDNLPQIEETYYSRIGFLATLQLDTLKVVLLLSLLGCFALMLMLAIMHALGISRNPSTWTPVILTGLIVIFFFMQSYPDRESLERSIPLEVAFANNLFDDADISNRMIADNEDIRLQINSEQGMKLQPELERTRSGYQYESLADEAAGSSVPEAAIETQDTSSEVGVQSDTAFAPNEYSDQHNNRMSRPPIPRAIQMESPPAAFGALSQPTPDEPSDKPNNAEPATAKPVTPRRSEDMERDQSHSLPGAPAAATPKAGMNAFGSGAMGGTSGFGAGNGTREFGEATPGYGGGTRGFEGGTQGYGANVQGFGGSASRSFGHSTAEGVNDTGEAIAPELPSEEAPAPMSSNGSYSNGMMRSSPAPTPAPAMMTQGMRPSGDIAPAEKMSDFNSQPELSPAMEPATPKQEPKSLASNTVEPLDSKLLRESMTYRQMQTQPRSEQISLWQPAIKAQSGIPTELIFKTPDRPGLYFVSISGYTEDGVLGTDSFYIKVSDEPSITSSAQDETKIRVDRE